MAGPSEKTLKQLVQGNLDYQPALLHIPYEADVPPQMAKLGWLQVLPKFFGSPQENPHLHIRELSMKCVGR